MISFHSLEDRIVKDAFRLASTDCICPPKMPICICGHHASVRLITRKPIIADDAEIAQNPRSRSAKLRVVEKLMSQWLQHTLDRSRWRPQRQALALAMLGLFVAIIMGALYLSQSSSTSALGRQLEDLIAQRDDLEQDNEQLRAEIASLESMPRLEARAQELGFVAADGSDIEYLVVDGYNPNRQTLSVVPLQAKTDPVPTYDESFTGWVQQQIDSLRRQFENFGTQSSQTARQHREADVRD